MESYSKISLNLSERQFHDPSTEDSCQKGFQLSYNQLPKDEAKAPLRLSHFYFSSLFYLTFALKQFSLLALKPDPQFEARSNLTLTMSINRTIGLIN